MKRIVKPHSSWRYGKRDWKHPYRKSRRFDKSCRCNGDCGYCYGNRMASLNRLIAEAENQEKEIWQEL